MWGERTGRPEGRKKIPDSNNGGAGPAGQRAENKKPESNYRAAGPACQEAEKRFLKLIMGQPDWPAGGQKTKILNLFIMGWPDRLARGQKKIPESNYVVPRPGRPTGKDKS